MKKTNRDVEAEAAEPADPAPAPVGAPRVCVSVTVSLPAGFRLDNGIARPAGEYDVPPEVASPILRRWPQFFVRKNYEDMSHG